MIFPCGHIASRRTSWSDDQGTHTRDHCSRCGATRTYTRTAEGFCLGGYWDLLDGVKLEGLTDEGKQDGRVP
jgi:hypothetical protein